ncbi:hypothetical protein C5167_005893 [Papaver somniferum]|uniref:Uncharacterized protein n=1 Tax=Papaver somniferum TaxID=3469 RepID=A0A4Y7JDI2_PAPSO|nr:hypothetical protein C5167_005893 [Papaver somniferum]
METNKVTSLYIFMLDDNNIFPEEVHYSRREKDIYPAHNEHRLFFNWVTKVTYIFGTQVEIPHHKFTFIPFKDLESHSANTHITRILWVSTKVFFNLSIPEVLDIKERYTIIVYTPPHTEMNLSYKPVVDIWITHRMEEFPLGEIIHIKPETLAISTSQKMVTVDGYTDVPGLLSFDVQVQIHLPLLAPPDSRFSKSSNQVQALPVEEERGRPGICQNFYCSPTERTSQPLIFIMFASTTARYGYF